MRRTTARRSCNFFVFFDKDEIHHIRIDANRDGKLPVDEAAGLLAMHCVANGRTLSDYILMLPARSQNPHGLAKKAEKLLRIADAARSLDLSPRQKQILDMLLRDQENKAIALKLNIAVRTVKFHVSNLLSKFGVENREQLVRKVMRMMRSQEWAAISALSAEADSSSTPSSPKNVVPLRASVAR